MTKRTLGLSVLFYALLPRNIICTKFVKADHP